MTSAINAGWGKRAVTFECLRNIPGEVLRHWLRIKIQSGVVSMGRVAESRGHDRRCRGIGLLQRRN